MDVLMPGGDGIEACREIGDTLPDTSVLMLTASTEKNAVLEAVAAGAAGYVQNHPTEQLLTTVRDVARGEYRMPRGRHETVVARLRNAPEQGDPPKRGKLTQREKEILVQFAKGMSYTAIAKSPGKTALRRCATPSTAYRTSWIRQQAGGRCLGPFATACWTTW